VLPFQAAAQSSLWLDGAFSSARPPAGAPQINTSNYGIAGVRGESLLKAWKLGANVSGGHALESAGGRWLWAQGEARHKWGQAGVFWLNYHEDFDYGTLGAQLTPEFKFANNALALRPHATLARWTTDGLEQTYGVVGAALQWTRTSGSLLFRVTGDAYSSGDNGYASGGYFGLRGEAFTIWRETTFGAGLLLGHNPIDDEAGFTVWASRALGERLRVDAQLTRTVAEAVFGTPGSLGFTLSASYRLFHHEPPPPIPLAAVGAAVTKGREVVFTVKVPLRARTVAVSGTFSDWRPVALKPAGDAWTGKVTVEPGTHQFGFLIDGTIWYVPPDAHDVIDDGFGRKNVTLVVRPK
jgi:hypothetical protein